MVVFQHRRLGYVCREPEQGGVPKREAVMKLTELRAAGAIAGNLYAIANEDEWATWGDDLGRYTFHRVF